MVPPDHQKTSSLPAPGGEKRPPGVPARFGTIPLVITISLVLLAVVVAGFVWHDLRRAYRDTLAFWNLFLTNSVNDRAVISTLWLGERQANAQEVADNASTLRLLTGSGKGEGEDVDTQRNVEEGLKRATIENGLLAGVVLNAHCQVVARAGPSTETDQNFASTCGVVLRSRVFEVVVPGVKEDNTRVHLAAPVFAEVQPSRSKPGFKRLLGVVLLISDLGKEMRTLITPGNEPTRTSEISVVWKEADRAVIISVSRKALGGQAYVEAPLRASDFEFRIIQDRDVNFGEFTDYQGVKVFGAARRLAISDGSIASKVDRREALAEFHQRAVSEGTAGALLIVLCGLIILLLHRRIATKELQEKLRQQEAMIELRRQAEASELKYKELFENANDAIVTFTLEGRFTSVNKASEQLLGYGRDEISKMDVSQILSPEYHDLLRQSVSRMLEGEKVAPQEVQLICKGGGRVLVESNRQLIYENNVAVGVQVIVRDITERRRTEKELRKLSRAVEQSPATVVITDPQGRIEYVNPKFTSLTGYTLQEVLGKNPRILKSDLTPVATYAQLWQTVLSGGEWRGEFANKKKNGELYWESASISPIRDAAGTIAHFVAVKEDITERKRIEAELAGRLRFETLLADLSSRFVNVPANLTDREIKDTQRRVCEGLGLDSASLWQATTENPSFITLTHNFRAPGGPEIPKQMDAREYFPWSMQQVLAGNVVAVSSLQELPPEAAHDREIYRQFGTRSVVTFPLSVGGGPVVGVLAFGTLRAECTWPQETVSRLQLVAQMFSNILARWRSDRALRESEERFRGLSDASYDGLCFSDGGTIVVANSRLAEMLGCEMQELLGSKVFEWVAPEVMEMVSKHISSGSEEPYEHLLRRKDGTICQVESRARYLPWKGKRVRATAIRDISDRKLAERQRERAVEELQSEKAFSEAVIDSLPGVVYVLDPQGDVIRWNKNAETILGYSHQELSALNTLDVIAEESRERVASKWGEAFSKGSAMGEARVLTKDGREVPFLLSAIRASIGDKVYVIGTGIDVTERKKAEQALTISEAKYRTLIEHAPDAIVVADMEAEKLVDFNENACHLFGLSRVELLKVGLLEVSPPVQPDGRTSRELALEYMKEALAGRPTVFEWTHRNTLGMDIPCEVRFVRLPSRERRLIRGSITDITERKQAAEALNASQEMFYRAFHSSPEPICIIASTDGKFLDANKAFCDEVGYLREEVIDRSPSELGLPLISGLNAQQLRLLDQGGLRDLEVDLRTKSEEVRNALISLVMVEIAGQPCILAQGRDVTEYRRTEKALRASEQRYRAFIAHSQEGVWRIELDHPVPIDLPMEKQFETFFEYAYMAECNDAMARFYGESTANDLIGRRIRDLVPISDEGRLESFRSAAWGGWKNRTIQFQTVDKAGRPVHLERTEVPIIENGKLTRVWGLMRDVTDLHEAEEALRGAVSRYRLLFERNLAGVVRISRDGRIMECNEAFAQILGYGSREDLESAHVGDFYLEKSDGTAFMDYLKQHQTMIGEEFHTRRKDGKAAWILASASLVEDEDEGSTILASAFDITQWKDLGEQLRQSQKMEAVGRLAGGVAHDFNNMLQIINGYSELIVDQLPPQSPVRSHVQDIKSTVERAAGLTRQLLAFSRQQVLAPQVLNLNVAIGNLSKMLRRVLGEDVELAVIEGHPLGSVKADPGQIDQVILNLAVNARHAMPQGGKLTIEMANVQIDEAYAQSHFPMTPGPYVMIAVRDTGYGMDAETRARIFEPFFTTREKGTGLGLATVYGIVKQSGGFIWVQSEVKKGTTFKVFLPPVTEVPATMEIKTVPAKERGSETVLLAEDEEYVRSLVRWYLQSKGYTVLEARNGQDALRVAQEHDGPIHLLITDIVMPGMNGRELAKRMALLRPEMKTIYMSGYAHDASLPLGALDSGGEVLQKPFTSKALASKVRQMLEEG